VSGFLKFRHLKASLGFSGRRGVKICRRGVNLVIPYIYQIALISRVIFRVKWYFHFIFSF
jgi:hypothetical protein